jgi:4'-phosphopantetheinyl transferase EntD
VDAETLASRIMRETADMFTSPQEQTRLQHCPLDWEQALLVTFSAKEALFKSLYPLVKRYLDFDCAEISELDVHRGSLTLTLTQVLSDSFPAGYHFYGKWQFAGDVVTTCFYPQIPQ